MRPRRVRVSSGAPFRARVATYSHQECIRTRMRGGECSSFKPQWRHTALTGSVHTYLSQWDQRVGTLSFSSSSQLTTTVMGLASGDVCSFSIRNRLSLGDTAYAHDP